MREKEVMPRTQEHLAKQVCQIRISTLMGYSHHRCHNCFSDLVKAYGVVLLLEDQCRDRQTVVVAEEIRGPIKGYPEHL